MIKNMSMIGAITLGTLFGAENAFDAVRLQKAEFLNTRSTSVTFDVLSKYMCLKMATPKAEGRGVIAGRASVDATSGTVFFGKDQDGQMVEYPGLDVLNYKTTPLEINQKQSLTLQPQEKVTLDLPFPHYFSGIRGSTNFEWDAVEDAVTVNLGGDGVRGPENQNFVSTPQDLMRQLDLYKKYFMEGRDVSYQDIIEDFKNKGSGVLDTKRTEEVIVTLTSYPARFATTWLAIESLLRQEERPDRVNINLFEGEFPGRVLPWFIRQQMKRGLEVNWVYENTKSYKKLIPTIQKFPNAVVITYDDDVIVYSTAIAELINAHTQNPEDVVCASCIKITKDNLGRLDYFKKFDFSYNVMSVGLEHAESNNLIIEGGAGTLYPKSTYSSLLNHLEYAVYLKSVDDIYFTGCVLRACKNIRKCKTSKKLEFIDGSYDIPTALYHGNFRNGCLPMDIYLRKMMEIFVLYADINILEPLLNSSELEAFDQSLQNPAGEYEIIKNEDFCVSKKNSHFTLKIKNITDQKTVIFPAFLKNELDLTARNILFMSHEPSSYRANMSRIRSNLDKLFLLVHNSDEFSYIPNSLRTIGTFIYGNIFGGFSQYTEQKSFSVSFLASVSYGQWGDNPYNLAESNQLRYSARIAIFKNEKSINNIPTKFYVSSRGEIPEELKARTMPNNDKSLDLFQSQFTIAVENIQEKDYFSEKLFEPLMNRVVPIYIGCPNICDYFDVRGMILAKDADDAISKINQLSSSTYSQILPFIELNYKKAWEYYNALSLKKILQQRIKISHGLSESIFMPCINFNDLKLNYAFWFRDDKKTEDENRLHECVKLLDIYK